MSRVEQVANQMLLASCFSLQVAGQMAGWAQARLRLLYTPSSFPLQVTTASGQLTTVNAVRLPSLWLSVTRCFPAAWQVTVQALQSLLGTAF